MSPIVEQVVWVVVFFLGMGISGASELFRKYERAYEITSVWVRNGGT